MTKKIITEDVSTMLSKELNVDASSARKLIVKLDFSSYLDLTQALKNGDHDEVRRIAGKVRTDEVNSYTVARTGGSGTEMAPEEAEQVSPDGMDAETDMDIDSLGAGSDVTIDGETTKVNDVSSLGAATKFSTDDGHDVTVSKGGVGGAALAAGSEEGAMSEIDKMKKLAGIKEESIEEEIGSPTPMSCKAMSRDGSTPPNQIIKRHKKKKKPGPDIGSKYK